MNETITKIDDVTVAITTSKTVNMPLEWLVNERDTLQARVDVLNGQITEAQGLGVLTQADKQTQAVIK